MRRRTVICTGTAALAAGFLIPGTAAFADVGGYETRLLLERVATARREAGLTALTRDPALDDMARRHALHILCTRDATHFDAEGRNPAGRARQAGFAGAVLGETLAETYDGPRETGDLWLAHETTRAVLMAEPGRLVGIAGLREATGLVWWDLVVGRAPRRFEAAS